MRADLARVDRARTPWLIAAMHAPWYNSNLAHQLEAEDMRSVMEPILYSYGVDLIFAGAIPPLSPARARARRHCAAARPAMQSWPLFPSQLFGLQMP